MGNKFWGGLADKLGLKFGEKKPMVKSASAGVDVVPLPDRIVLREARAAGFFRLARPMGWGLYRVEDIDGGLGSIWSIEKAADGSQFLVKQVDPEGEVLRKTAGADGRIPAGQNPKCPKCDGSVIPVGSEGLYYNCSKCDEGFPASRVLWKTAKIVKEDGGYEVQSEKGKNLGDFDTEGEAKHRLQQVEYFKHKAAPEFMTCPGCGLPKLMGSPHDADESGNIPNEKRRCGNRNCKYFGNQKTRETEDDFLRRMTSAQDAAIQRVAVAPPGEEKLVKDLKHDPKVDNPWAVAWSVHNKKKAAAQPGQPGQPPEEKLWEEEYEQPHDGTHPCENCGGSVDPDYRCRRCGAYTCGSCGTIPEDVSDSFLCMGCEEIEREEAEQLAADGGQPLLPIGGQPPKKASAKHEIADGDVIIKEAGVEIIEEGECSLICPLCLQYDDYHKDGCKGDAELRCGWCLLPPGDPHNMKEKHGYEGDDKAAPARSRRK